MSYEVLEKHYVTDVVVVYIPPETEDQEERYRFIFLFSCMSTLSILVKAVSEAFIELAKNASKLQWVFINEEIYLELNEAFLLSSKEAQIEGVDEPFVFEDEDDEDEDQDQTDTDSL